MGHGKEKTYSAKLRIKHFRYAPKLGEPLLAHSVHTT